MNNELYHVMSDPEYMPRGSPSFVQHELQQRLHNRINQLIDSVRHRVCLSVRLSVCLRGLVGRGRGGRRPPVFATGGRVPHFLD